MIKYCKSKSTKSSTFCKIIFKKPSMYIKNAILAEILETLISQKLNMYVVITASRSISNCTTTEWIVYQVEWLVLLICPRPW